MESDTLNIDNVLEIVRRELGQEYQFIERLGGGEFSNVYRIRQVDTGQEHALKVMDYHYLLQRLRKADFSDSDSKYNEIKRRFVTEARLYKKIEHSNIVKIYDTGLIEDQEKGLEIPYIIMSYIKGASLSSIIRGEGPMKVERVVKIARDVLLALEEIHKHRVIHRDLKPANIMIKENTGEAVIIDFGIAKEIVDTTRLTSTGALLGSPVYMAPEQFADSSKVGPNIDIYSFGVVIYEMLTGDAPFKGSNFIEIMHAHQIKTLPDVRQRNPEVPQYISTALCRAMSKDPSVRYATPTAFLDALEGRGDDGARKPKFYKSLLPGAALLILAVLFWIFNPFTNEKQQPVTDHQPSKKPDEIVEKIDSGKPPAEQPEKIIEKPEPEKIEENPAEIALKQFNQLISDAKKNLENEDFDRARQNLLLAKDIKAIKPDTDEIISLEKLIEQRELEYEQRQGTEVFKELSKAPVNHIKYLEFKKAYPQSRYLDKLKNQLSDDEPNLPPEKYWDKPIQKNSKGYYEFVFGEEHNRHRMIYMTGRNIWIDKYEVSNAQFRRSSTVGGAVTGTAEDRFIRQGDTFPAVVSYNNAVNYCKEFGFRLPTMEEWSYAAGKGKYIYPWGNQLPGEGEKCRANYDSLGDTGERDGFEGTAPVDSFKEFASPFGAVNMAGNVWEWTDKSFLKGGGFLSIEDDLSVETNKSGGDSKEGFRCVREEK